MNYVTKLNKNELCIKDLVDSIFPAQIQKIRLYKYYLTNHKRKFKNPTK